MKTVQATSFLTASAADWDVAVEIGRVTAWGDLEEPPDLV